MDSGSATSEVVIPTWEFYDSMGFIDITLLMDESVSTLDDYIRSLPPTGKKRKAIKPQEQHDSEMANIELYKALATSLQNRHSMPRNHLPEKEITTNERRAELFGKLVSDSLLQCDMKDWPMIKKKVMDIFFEYEHRHLQGYSSLPYNYSTSISAPEQPHLYPIQPSNYSNKHLPSGNPNQYSSYNCWPAEIRQYSTSSSQYSSIPNRNTGTPPAFLTSSENFGDNFHGDTPSTGNSSSYSANDSSIQLDS